MSFGKGFKFVELPNGARLMSVVVDPSAGAGIAADVGTIALRSNAGAGEIWLKTGAADTAWSRLATE